jgi:urease accessory protein
MSVAASALSSTPLSSPPPGVGWQARLALRFGVHQARTRLSAREHRGPLLVQRAFYPEAAARPDDTIAEPCHVYLIHPPGGIVSGDELQLQVEVGSGAHALLTTPAAGKFYRRHGERVARLSQQLAVDAGALEWLPQENIYYPNAVAEVSTVVRLRTAARFIGWEISCFGLPANGADLGEGRVRQRFELWHEERPVLLERLTIDRQTLQARWGLAGHVACGTLLCFPAGAADLARARAAADCTGLSIACTLLDGALCCRGFDARTDRLKQGFIDLWQALRAPQLGRPACVPRIWMT